jgi:hypothetical protein
MLLKYYEHISAVVSTGHERCCNQVRDMYTQEVRHNTTRLFQPGSLFIHWATWVWLCQQDMSAVAPRGHRMCTHLDIQGLSHNPPLCVADYCLVPCTPPLHATHVQARSFVVVEIVCISIYYKNLCERPLLLHYIKHHTCVLLSANGCAIRKCVSCVLCAHTKQHLQLRSVCCP